MKDRQGVPAWIVLAGDNGIFKTDILFEGVPVIEDTEKNPLPQHFIDGLSCIADILIVDMSCGVEYFLN